MGPGFPDRGGGEWGGGLGVKSEDYPVEVSRPGKDDLIVEAVGSDSKQSQLGATGETREVLSTIEC